MHKLQMLISGFIACAIIVNCAAAEPYTPSSPDDIIAEWHYPTAEKLRRAKTQKNLQPQDVVATAVLANEYLRQAAQPGYSRLYGLAQAALKPFIDNNSDSVAIWLAWAQVKQHQHDFAEAQQALQKIFIKEPANVTAQLMAARIYLVQDNPQAARNGCLKLFGYTDLLTLGACSLEATSQVGLTQLAESYAELQQLIITQGLPTDERQSWILQMLADMAIRLHKPHEAATFLEQVTRKNSLSYWVQWADVQLALANANHVLDTLTPLLDAAPDKDDALLLRVVLAEKQLQQTSSWQPLLAARIALREERGDTQHASDLAMYYLDVHPNPEKALHWAKINIEQAREPGDKQLLARAQQQLTISQFTEK